MFAEAKKLQVPDLWDNTALEKYSTLLEVSFLIASKHTGGMYLSSYKAKIHKWLMKGLEFGGLFCLWLKPEEDHYHQRAEDLKITDGAEFKAVD